MKSLLLFLSHVLVFWGLTYVLFSAGAATFDIAAWATGTRAVFIIILIVWGWVCLTAEAERERKNESNS